MKSDEERLAQGLLLCTAAEIAQEVGRDDNARSVLADADELVGHGGWTGSQDLKRRIDSVQLGATRPIRDSR
jgi:hypothetical protein